MKGDLKMENKGRVFLICEGEHHTLLYLLNNGLVPFRVYFDALAIRMYLPYMTKEDEVLIVLTGLTDFTAKEIDELMRMLHEFYGERSTNIKLFTPFRLVGIDHNYYIYSNDLVYCDVKGVVEGKIVTLTNTLTSKNNTKDLNTETKVLKNVVLEPYLTFEGVEVGTVDTVIVENDVEGTVETVNNDPYINSILRVDMYK